MAGMWKTLWTLLWLGPTLAGWDALRRLADEVDRGWVADYQLAFCARYQAMEKNLEAARLFLGTQDPEADWASLWEEEENRVLASWAEAVTAADCGPDLVYRLYEQENPQLPRGYPNWWIRWIWPSDPEEAIR